jgi:hypothetical protein
VAGGPLETLVKGLLKILLVGFVVFMALAMSQEWEVFSSAWFAEEPSAPETEVDAKPAADVVHLTLTLMGHLYTSGGDERFAERMPAADGMIEEMLADIDYLKQNHRRQEMSLERLEVTSVDPIGPGRIEIRTREHWSVRFLTIGGNTETDPPLQQIAHGKFLVALGTRGWRVEGWEVLDPIWEKAVGSS